MKSRATNVQEVPLGMVGSTVFGRYPIISVQQTYNMIMSDKFLVDYAGYHVTNIINPNGLGRGIYKSSRLNKMVVVIFDSVYLVTPNLSITLIFNLNTFVGDVFIAEDNANHIAVCDKVDIWIYNTLLGTVQKATTNGGPLDFIPGYVAFQNTRFVSVDINGTEWCLSNPLTGNTDFPNGVNSPFRGGFQTKANTPLAAVPFPGKGNLIFVMGQIVTEIWQDVGNAAFPYIRLPSVDIDYGCINSDTIAISETFLCWLGINEKSGPAILMSEGGPPKQLSNDGINYKLSQLEHPEDSHGYIFKQDGHIFYVLTFPTDNFSITYDFITEKFFTITDENYNYHIAKGVAFFDNTYYFVSLVDGFLYQMSTNDTTYEGREIPRVRVCPTFRMQNTSAFVANSLSFPIEQGFEDLAELPVVDLSVSYDNGYVFSNAARMTLNPLGYRKNRFIYYNMGWGNSFTPQFKFYSKGRFVVGEGTLGIYQ